MSQATLAAALAFYSSGDLGNAEIRCRDRLATEAADPQALALLGLIESARGNHRIAVDLCERAMALDGNSAGLLDTLGTVYSSSGRYAEALSAYDKAISVDAGLLNAHNNRGVLLEYLGKITEAMASYGKALAIRADVAELHANMANALKELCEFDRSIAHYERALALNPRFSRGHSALLFCLNYHPRLETRRLLERYQDWDDRYAKPLRSEWLPHGNDRDTGRRLRVAYLSPDFRHHSVRFFAEPLIANHDRGTVEVWCYSDVAAPDDATRRFQEIADHWEPVAGMQDDALAGRIRADGIDVLVDLAGHTARNRLLVFGRKPAPVQVSWLGYGYTTGLSAMDYFLATDALMPVGSDRFVCEKVYRLPRTHYCYQPSPEAPDVGPLPARRNGYLTFGCFSRTIRLNDMVIGAWCRILNSVPDSVLVLNCKTFVDAGAREIFALRFKQRGVDPARVRMVFTTPQRATWAAYNDVDIALDPFPHNAGTTTFEALWMGVPVLTLASRPPLGTIGKAVLAQLGMDDWVAASEGDYVRLAKDAAKDVPRLEGLRRDLRRRMAASALCDAKSFARDVERSFRVMWQRWLEFQA